MGFYTVRYRKLSLLSCNNGNMGYKAGKRWRTNTTTAVGLLCGLLIIGASPLCGQKDAVNRPNEAEQIARPADRTVSFADDVFPILKQKCLNCHEGANPESGVRLDHYAKMIGQSDGIPLVISGKSEQSLLIHVVSGLEADLQMPPEDAGEPLSDEEIGILRAWIDQGVQWDEEVAPNPNAVAAKGHWAFQPIRRPRVPQAKFIVWDATRNRRRRISTDNSIDAFISQGHRAHKVYARPQADPATLLRRLYLVLHGVPPSNDQLTSFLADNQVAAWEAVVDEVLSSDHYGERIGRFWLDSARWAESEGYAQNNPRPTAWRYRDYVIDSFNSDLPYSEFIRQQIAGDELQPYRDVNLIATGFLAAARISADDLHFYRAENDMYTDMVSAISRTVLGLTIGCARCHDHKFDPISQRDFYRLKAFFTRGFPGNIILKDSDKPAEVDQIARDLLEFDLQVRKRVLSTGYEEEPQNVRDLLNTKESERTLAQEREYRPYRTKMNIQIAGCNAFRINEDEKKRLEELRAKLDGVVKDTPQTWGFYSPVTSPHVLSTLPMAGNFPLLHDKTRLVDQKDYLLARGQIFETVATVTPGWPEAFGTTPDLEKTDRNRSVLANWLVADSNPLTARVWVNRIWQFHFGTGLVDTPGNFGVKGSTPTHPGLLDWLASELIANNWSTKHIHRLIVTSETWRQRAVSVIDEGALPDTSLLTAWPRRRMEAEIIRDSMLLVSGELNREIGGVSVPVDQESQNTRRGIYLFQTRDAPPELQSLFDGPTASSEACLERQVSTSALQSLYLLNDDFAQRRAIALAQRIRESAGEDMVMQVQNGFEYALGREPDAEELALSLDFLKDYSRSIESVADIEDGLAEEPPEESLVLWLRADAEVFSDDDNLATHGGSVSKWLDQTDGEEDQLNEFAQTDKVRRPTLLSGRFNGMSGLPVIRFSGGAFGTSDHLLVTPHHESLNANNGYAIATSVRFNGKGNRNEPVFVKVRNGGNDIACISVIRMAKDGRLAIGQNIDGQWGDRLFTPAAVPDGVPLVITARWRDNKLDLHVVSREGELASVSTELEGQIDFGVGGEVSVGGYTAAFSDDGERMNGDIGELLYFNSGIDDSQLQQAESYLSGRWLKEDDDKLTALELFSQSLLNLNEFIYIE
ncbi:MAG TPA: hypothetical protein DHW38_07605 [Planctomycetaceae bacterium]|nr:hypothetical protein [Planctomycetaceae bacterium]